MNEAKYPVEKAKGKADKYDMLQGDWFIGGGNEKSTGVFRRVFIRRCRKSGEAG